MNRIFTRNTLFSLVGIFIFSLSFFVPKSIAHAVEMSDVFPSKYISDPCDPPTWSWFGYSATIVKENYLQVISDGTGGESAYIKVRWALNDGECSESGQRAAVDNTTEGVIGKFDAKDNFGYWDSIFLHWLQGQAYLPYTDPDAGIFLQIAKKYEPILSPNGTRNGTQAESELSGKVTYTLTDPKGVLTIPPLANKSFTMNGLETKSIGYYLVTPIPSFGSTFFGKGDGTFTVPISGLEPNTDYYVRVALLEGGGIAGVAGSIDVSYSEPLLIHTLAKDTPIPAPSGVIDGTNTNENPSIISGLDCGIGFGTGNFPDCIVQVLYYVIYIPSAWILAGTGYLFNAFSLLSISSYMYSNASFITEGWKTIRDLMNMFFIFALLYAAIRIIISKDSAGSIAPLIKNIIVTAILINFSLFIVKIGIDASNITARIFYNAIGVTVTSGNTDTITNQAVIGTPEVNISQGIVAGFGIQRVTSEAELDAINKSGHNTSVVAILLIFGIIINLTAAGVFFTVGVLFVGRIVGFYMAMLFAPIAFMSEIIPIFKKIPQMDKAGWQSNLLKDIILAPLFLFFIWIILGLAGTDFLAKIAPDKSDDWTKMLVMIALEGMVILSMLVAAKKLAESQASFFGGQVNAVLSKGLNFVTGTAIGLASGGAALAGRATLGKKFSSMASSESLKAKAAEGGFGGWYARQKLKTWDGLSKSTFDARNTMAGTLAKDKTGFDFNTAPLKTLGFSTDDSKGGYAGAEKRRHDKIIADAKLLEASDGEMKSIKARTALLTSTAQQEYKDMRDEVEGMEKKALGMSQEAQRAALKKFGIGISKLNDDQLAELKKELGEDKVSDIVKNSSQFNGKQKYDYSLNRKETRNLEATDAQIDEIMKKTNRVSDTDKSFYEKYNGKSKDEVNRERKNAYAATLRDNTKGLADAAPILTPTTGAAIGGAVVAGAIGAAAAAPVAVVTGLNRRINRDAELHAADTLEKDIKTTGKLDEDIATVKTDLDKLVKALKGSNIQNLTGTEKFTKLDPDFDITKAINKYDGKSIDTKEAIDRALGDLDVHRRAYEKKEKALDATAAANQTNAQAQLDHGDAIRELRNINKHIKNLEGATKDHNTLQDRLDRLTDKKFNQSKGGDKKDKDKDDKK